MIIKQSFTLFEVLISLVILGVVLSSITKLFKSTNDIDTYSKLQFIENEYIEKGTISYDKEIIFK